MARLTLDISMSLDGFVAGPNQTGSRRSSLSPAVKRD
jgi:hypothetical protein